MGRLLAGIAALLLLSAWSFAQPGLVDRAVLASAAHSSSFWGAVSLMPSAFTMKAGAQRVATELGIALLERTFAVDFVVVRDDLKQPAGLVHGDVPVGTGGGGSEGSISEPIANSEVRIDHADGVLKLTLHPKSYEWEFVPVEGESFTDSGGDQCH